MFFRHQLERFLENAPLASWRAITLNYSKARKTSGSVALQRYLESSIALCLVPLLAALVFTFPFSSLNNALAASYNLVLKDESGAVLSLPVDNGYTFAIRYTHSVAQSPVTDYFFIKGGAIWLDKTVYHDFGAGLPHFPENGQKMYQRDGELVISDFNRRLGNFSLRVGRVANHVLLLGDKRKHGKAYEEIRLDTLAKPGSAISFEVEYVSK